MHASEHACSGPEAERRANAFASAFLMPRASVLGRIPSGTHVEQIIRGKRIWKVSAMALTYRLRDLRLAHGLAMQVDLRRIGLVGMPFRRTRGHAGAGNTESADQGIRGAAHKGCEAFCRSRGTGADERGDEQASVRPHAHNRRRRWTANRTHSHAGPEVPAVDWTAGVYAAGVRFCLSRDLVSSGVTYP
ncbi:ImmA/IrrE family metallo-endopeptidase [Streptomyces cyaneofuscatus]|uniref:ImmA/IrrE family metallo-endopeptidase n=1 Tax=Streptomyces cyaneofuscatus TaxID=66883 RepID=UPI0036511E55